MRETIMFQAVEPIIHTKLFWLSAVVLIIYAYLKYVTFAYWKKKGVPHEEPRVVFGNALPSFLGKQSLGDLVKRNYEKFKKHRYHGIYMFHQPILMINDPELIRLVLIKEFNKFRDRGLYYNDDVDPLSGHLFFLPGEKWRKLRAKLSPTFTSGKLRQMYPLLREIGDELVKVTLRSCSQKSDVVELKSLIGRYTTDSIASIAFGHNCKSLDDPDNEFKRYGSIALDQNPVKAAIGAFAPMILDLLRIPWNRPECIQFFSKTFQDMVNHRKKNNLIRRDFLNLLMQLMDKGALDDEKSNDSDSDKIGMMEAAAQAFVFFVAGYETTSSTITYCLYELAMNPEIQEKLYDELSQASEKPGGFTYDRITNELEYLHMVFSETLRKHPSVPFLNRICLEDCDIPNSDFTIKKGTAIMISVTGLHNDPNFYPEPQKFDPMRFNKENVASRSPYVYLAFGDGPRVCIGTRFGILQSKIALIGLLMHFKIKLCDQTPIPILYSKRSIVQAPAGGVFVKLEKRSLQS